MSSDECDLDIIYDAYRSKFFRFDRDKVLSSSDEKDVRNPADWRQNHQHNKYLDSNSIDMCFASRHKVARKLQRDTAEPFDYFSVFVSIDIIMSRQNSKGNKCISRTLSM